MAKSIVFRFRHIPSGCRQLYVKHGFAASYLSTFATNSASRSLNYWNSNQCRFSFDVYNGQLRHSNAICRCFSHSSICQTNENGLKEEHSKVDSGQASANAGNQDKPLTQRQKLARTFAAYGTTGVVFHTCISLTSLGTCYMIVSR